jgi:Delta3-Delta2-enoyl-CoA isomerase
MILQKKHGNILELQLDRPPVNALRGDILDELHERIIGAVQDEKVQALVLSGKPGFFSAGLDVPFLLGLDRTGIYDMWKSIFAVCEALAKSPIPVCAAITGHSPAGGAVLSLYCDHRIMSRGRYKIGLNEVQVGLPLPGLLYEALVYVVGSRQAERLAVGGLLLCPQRALEVGLVDELSDEKDVLDAAIQWSQTLLRSPQIALRLTRKRCRQKLVDTFAVLDEAMLHSFVDVWFSEETQITMKAMVDKLRKSSKKG